METSSSSSNTTLHDRTPSKLSPEQRFELEVATANAHPPLRETWYARLDKRLASRIPGIHEKVARAVQYVKGPRPKVDLPGLHPLLNINIITRRYTFELPLESTLIRVTHPFTNPWLMLLAGAIYIIGLAFLSRAESFLTPSSSFIDCTSTYWAANNGCGLNGEACFPFDDSTFDFRCPARCNGVTLANPRTVGNEQAVFVPLIVGGGDDNETYRGDSFVCAAASQAGLITNSKGGCASLQLIGNFTNFLPKSANGLTSLGFPTVFPLSFRFLPSTSLTHCTDIRDVGLAFNVLVTCLLFLVLRPRPLVLYWCLVCIGYWHISLFSQTRRNPPPLDEAFGIFLPTLFIAYAFWRLAFRFTLPAFAKAPIEAMVWYLGPFWVGVLTNLTFSKVPIDRLTTSDLTKRSGAITALVIIVCVLLLIVINQVRIIRKTGWLPWYAGWYVLGGLVLLVLSQLPGLQLRLHHYIVAMVSIPGTAFPTRLSAIYQGFLLGLFLNGVAAFGFASILQTAADLQRDAPSGSPLPSFLTNSTTYNSSIPLANQTISWNALTDDWDGFALLIDDVERYVGTALNFSLASLDVGLPHFFRLAFTNQGGVGDFTMPATLWSNGTWVNPLPGPS